jgi:hypothetical protein
MDSTERIKLEMVAGFVATTLLMTEAARWAIQNALSQKERQPQQRQSSVVRFRLRSPLSIFKTPFNPKPKRIGSPTNYWEINSLTAFLIAIQISALYGLNVFQST